MAGSLRLHIGSEQSVCVFLVGPILMVEYCRVKSAVPVSTKGKFSCFTEDNFQSYRLHRQKCAEQSETGFDDLFKQRMSFL
jgi:hypothetical protein